MSLLGSASFQVTLVSWGRWEAICSLCVTTGPVVPTELLHYRVPQLRDAFRAEFSSWVVLNRGDTKCLTFLLNITILSEALFHLLAWAAHPEPTGLWNSWVKWQGDPGRDTDSSGFNVCWVRKLLKSNVQGAFCYQATVTIHDKKFNFFIIQKHRCNIGTDIVP